MGNEKRILHGDEAIQEEILKLEKRKENRKHVRLFFHPIKTIKYFGYVIADMLMSGIKFFQTRPKLLFSLMLPISLVLLILYTPGNHQKYLGEYSEFFSVCLWWIGLGILSSVGLGTGLHTFVLYLGPHIAKVTLAATEWQSTNFKTYGLDSFINPHDPVVGGVSFLDILQKVQIAALMWGAGTAIGELPPYFVARTARLKGMRLGEDQKKSTTGQDEADQSFIGKLSAKVPSLIGNLGFFGILAFASIPNPLFDLAGLTCGHFLVPFWKFFGATLIGKAVIKAHLQACFVILMFNVETLATVVTLIEYYIPWATGKIQPLLEKERQKLNSNVVTTAGKSLVGVIWDCVLAVMISYFIISIIDSSVQEYLIKKDENKIELLKSKISTVKSNSKKNN
ncbi:transmembrane protein [Tieghemostelium lacteum]|uniref:Transmembrane protein n=1 Tax=Tieghemostelium lacteum TaxID=361077 RepID=A0A152A0Q8_TIELA|nr:transmembrane protein [Tieghemostelium lacteum]|eukprot:KYQ99827.1 transmembrane protein [Tieghemostelium lacteum]